MGASYYCSAFSLSIPKRDRPFDRDSTSHMRGVSECEFRYRYKSVELMHGIYLSIWAGGDGPKLIELLQMREKHRLQDRIELLGSVRHEDVSSVSVLDPMNPTLLIY